MKKSLIKISVLLLTFSIGFIVSKTFSFNKNHETNITVEKIPSISAEKKELGKEQVVVIENNIEESVNEETVSAWYSLDYYKNMPEVAMIKIYGANFDDDGKKLDKMYFESGIYTNLSDDVDEGFAEGIQTKVEGNKLRFKTKKLKGIEYHFQGIFFKGKMTGEQNEKVLRGTLQKFIKGKKIAEVSGDFEYSEPYCLH